MGELQSTVSCAVRMRSNVMSGMQVRRHLFQGKHAGRLVVLTGTQAEVFAALSICVQVLHESENEAGGHAFDDSANWGYTPPNNEVCTKSHCRPRQQQQCTIYVSVEHLWPSAKLKQKTLQDDHGLHTFPLHHFCHWRDQGFFKDRAMPLRLQSAGCWLPLWAVLMAHELGPPPDGDSLPCPNPSAFLTALQSKSYDQKLPKMTPA